MTDDIERTLHLGLEDPPDTVKDIRTINLYQIHFEPRRFGQMLDVSTISREHRLKTGLLAVGSVLFNYAMLLDLDNLHIEVVDR
ncbi:MAG: hypothetical protein AAGA73_09865 [Pseudomonadota bacterium]